MKAHFAGYNHPLRVGPVVGAMSTMGQMSKPWPKRSTPRQASQLPPNLPGMNVGSLRPIVLPKFVSNPKIVEETGYQKAHLLYDEMQQFFARKATVEHQNEVVIIKFTMMSLKPGYRNPQVVSVRDERLSKLMTPYRRMR